jgi:DNA topoisomerase-2
MYVGSTERVPATSAGSVLHSWDFKPGEGGGRVSLLPPDSAHSDYSPALCKVFDEILVNAADNRLRDKNTTLIEVTLDPLEPRITVTNNGRGLPVERHPTETLWVPELVFGHLLTGSNFDDGPAAGGGAASANSDKDASSLSLERLTGGRHGYGAKLANILAHEFTVDT